MTIKGNIVYIEEKKIYLGNIVVENGKIKTIEVLEQKEDKNFPYILPGFIDSHIHIESSMLTPRQFARMAVVHGTVATISDPHEIANVCGMQGVEYMINDAKGLPFHFYFGAPSCVPATIFETAGATISVKDIDNLLQRNEIKYLSEMMNFPGVLFKDEEVLAKIEIAKKYKKPIDGHAPGLRGNVAKNYINANTNDIIISTDHECFTSDEALDKLKYGMKILIREGSAAKNFEALINLLNDWEDMMMFCSDDKHPDSLELNHINALCERAVAKGIDVFKVLKAACINPKKHYKLEVGTLKENDNADFILVNNLQEFKILQTYINGILVAEKGKSFIETTKSDVINNFNCTLKKEEDFIFNSKDFDETLYAIEALDGQLITNKIEFNKTILIKNEKLESNIEKNILKIIVVNRYSNTPIAKAFIKNFGIKRGAIASSVAHDSHNIIAVGVNDESICNAVNLIIKESGGLSYSVTNKQNKIEEILSLPVAGLMTNEDGYAVSKQYTAMDRFVKNEMGCTLKSPYMTLSFMALLVIPHLKLSDKGLFDGDSFSFV